MQKEPTSGQSGLEGLAGTPQRVASPAAGNAPVSTMDDLMGLFGDSGGASGAGAPASAPMTNDDIMNGFQGMSLGDASQPPPPNQQMGGQPAKKSTQDLLDLF